MNRAFSPCRASVSALVLAMASSSWAQGSLTLEHAQRIAAGRSQQIVAQQAMANAAREQAVAAGQLPDPVLKLGIANLPINGQDQFSLTRDFMTMRNIGVMQEITRGEKRAARSGRYEREAQAAEVGRLVALASLQRDTALAWLDRHYLERMRGVLQAQRAEASLQVEAADAAYRGARGMQADVFAARSAVAQIDDRVRLNERQIATARIRLSRWVGDEAGLPLGAPPDMSSVRHHAAGLEAELAQHPQIALLLSQEEVARADAEVAQSNKHSDWSLEFMYSQRGPAYSNMVSLTASIPLQWDRKSRQDREHAARLALVEQLAAQRQEAMREHLAELSNWLQEWQGNRDRLAHYDSALISLAAERTLAAVAAYRGGAGPLAGVLEARRMEIDTRMERLRLEMETAALWVQLNYLVPTAQASATQPPAPVAPEK